MKHIKLAMLGIAWVWCAHTFAQTNLIVNPGFELGNISSNGLVSWANGWDRAANHIPAGGAGSPDLFDRRSEWCKIDIPTNKWADNVDTRIAGTNRYIGMASLEPIIGTFTTGALAAGCYNFSFYTRRTQGNHRTTCTSPLVVPPNPPLMKVKVFLSDFNGTLTPFDVFNMSPNWINSWTKLSSSFTLSPAQHNLYTHIVFIVDDESGAIFLDDVSLTPNGPFDMNLSSSSNYLLIENKVYNQSANEYACKGIIAGTDAGIPGGSGPVFVWENMDVKYTAGEAVTLVPGFQSVFVSDGSFEAKTSETCQCPDETNTTVDAGSDLKICSEDNGTISNYVGNGVIGSSCPGNVTWTANPSYALAWLSSSTSCTPNVVVPPNTDGYLPVTYTMTIPDGNGTYISDDVLVEVIHCINGVPTKNARIASEIQEQSSALSFSLYPNPTDGLLSLTIEGDFKTASLDITSILGNTIVSEELNVNKYQFDLSEYPNGIYFVTIATPNSRVVKKVVMK